MAPEDVKDVGSGAKDSLPGSGWLRSNWLSCQVTPLSALSFAQTSLLSIEAPFHPMLNLATAVLGRTRRESGGSSWAAIQVSPQSSLRWSARAPPAYSTLGASQLAATLKSRGQTRVGSRGKLRCSGDSRRTQPGRRDTESPMRRAQLTSAESPRAEARPPNEAIVGKSSPMPKHPCPPLARRWRLARVDSVPFAARMQVFRCEEPVQERRLVQSFADRPTMEPCRSC